jgi:hypothetical protein
MSDYKSTKKSTKSATGSFENIKPLSALYFQGLKAVFINTFYSVTQFFF